MSDAADIVRGSEKLTSIFGCWPSFHDAEVIELHLWRGRVDPVRKEYVFPVLTAKVHLWEMTRDVDSSGCFILRHHNLVTLRFHGVEDDIEVAGFNDQNAIYGLTFERRERPDGPSPFIFVEFEHGNGMAAVFSCASVEVLDVVPCDDEGHVAAES